MSRQPDAPSHHHRGDPPAATGRVLVVGDGAEDAEDALGRAVLEAEEAGAAASGVHVHDDSRLLGELSDVVAWAVAEMRVDRVLVVLPEAAGLEVPTGPEVFRGSREEVLAELAPPAPPADPAGPADGGTARGIRDRAPRVSLLIPVHQQEAFLDATLRSCLEQTYDDFEVIALDDGSTDATPSVLRRYAGHPRVRIVTQPNIGWTGQIHRVCNQLAREARGELHAWLGGDDVNLPHRLEAQVEAFDDDPDLDVCHGAAETIGVSGEHLGQVWNLERGYDDLSALREMLVGNLIGNPSAMIRAGAYQRVGYFEQGLLSDYSMWLKAAGRLRFRYLPRRLVQYRLHPAALSTSSEGFPRAEREALRLRGVALARRSLDDLFPELGGAGPRARYEAALSLGNRLLTVDHQLALQLYERAAEVASGPELDHDRGLAHALGGDLDAALVSAASAAAADPLSRPLLEALRAGGGRLVPREPRAHLDAALREGRARAARSARRWDGSPLGVERAYVAVDPARPDLAADALRSWVARTRSGAPLRWVFPDLGRGVVEVFEQVVAAARGADLDGAAELLVEAVDDLALLPPEDGRATGVLDGAAGAAAFTAWLDGRTEGRALDG